MKNDKPAEDAEVLATGSGAVDALAPAPLRVRTGDLMLAFAGGLLAAGDWFFSAVDTAAVVFSSAGLTFSLAWVGFSFFPIGSFALPPWDLKSERNRCFKN